MAIKRIKVSNFKSFKELDLELGNFNVVIGANASGKSNFTQIFKFLKDIEENSLNDAISMNGGLESLRNLKVGATADFEIEAYLDKTMKWGTHSQAVKVDEVTYRFTLKFGKRRRSFRIIGDQLIQKIEITKLHENGKKLFETGEVLSRGTITLSKIEDKLEPSFDPPDLGERLEKRMMIPSLSIFPKLFAGKLPTNTLLIRTPYSLIPPWETLFKNIAVYDIDPHIARNPVQITGKADLEKSGENLALVLNKIINNRDGKRKFCNLMKDLLSFFEDINTEKFAEKSVMIKLRESYYEDEFLRAYLLSDGTINITALIIVLCFEEKDLVIIEEPERNIHPHLISRLINMMKDASQNKQIIITTHSPEVVKHAGLENILLVSRDRNGFSVISRPKEKEEVKVFLKNELGLDELYIQDLLAV